MGRYKIFIALLLSFFSFFSASAYAITDAEMAAIRQQRAQAEYAAAVRAQIERYDQSVEYKANRNALSNQINGTVSAAETISDGSKVSSVSTISKAADAAKAAGTVAARYGKAALRGAPASFLGYAAFEGLMKGAGYVMGDGSKVIKNPTSECASDGSDCAYSQLLWQFQGAGGKIYTYSNPSAFAPAFIAGLAAGGIPNSVYDSFSYLSSNRCDRSWYSNIYFLLVVR